MFNLMVFSVNIQVSGIPACFSGMSVFRLKFDFRFFEN